MVFLRPWGLNDLARAKGSQVGVEPDFEPETDRKAHSQVSSPLMGPLQGITACPCPSTPPALEAESEIP